MHHRDPWLRVGCAGWTIPSQHAHVFPAQGTHLERYAQHFSGVEVNSSFYRPHRPTTYARWAASVPAQFQFAVKMPREITHTRRLVEVTASLERFLTEVQSLGAKLGPLLIQLPPSLHFTEPLAQTFLTVLRTRFHGSVVCEPRHGSWFSPAAEQLLRAFQVARVAADPARVPAAAVPGGWSGLVYYRWHGTPEMYVSAYTSAAVEALATQVAASARTVPTWCIFDNTARGAATRNALELLARQTGALTKPRPPGCGAPGA
jgi:uncharacterized protein YecE (DUF72 family)